MVILLIIFSPSYFKDAIQFTIEEFLEQYPYKIGDKVLREPYVGARRICEMRWDTDNNCIKYGIGVGEWFYVSQIQPYKEEMDRKYDVEEYLKVWKETEKGLEVVVNDRFELKEDNGKFYIIKKQPQYPKTYEECCKVLNLTKYPPALVPNKATYITQYKDFPHFYEIQKFAELLVCRDAYWKIAGEQMGLRKPWEPRWNDSYQRKWVINFYQNEIDFNNGLKLHFVLVFPTEEMRNVFYENFKELIELVKELL